MIHCLLRASNMNAVRGACVIVTRAHYTDRAENRLSQSRDLEWNGTLLGPDSLDATTSWTTANRGLGLG